MQAPTELTKGQGPCGSHAPRPPRRHPEPSPPTKRFHVLLNSLFIQNLRLPLRNRTLIPRYPSKPLWASMPQSTVDRAKPKVIQNLRLRSHAPGGTADLLAIGESFPIRRTLRRPYSTDPRTGRPQAEANKLHPRPRSAENGSSRMAATKCTWRQRVRVLADPTPPGRPAVTLNRHRRLRESLRLLLSGFTYS